MNRLLFAAVAFCAGIPLLLQTEAVAQRDCNSKQFVVSAVNLPPETHLSSQEQATVRLRLVGRCFDESQLTEATYRVRVAFQSFGYFRAKVLLPTVNVLDANRRPASVSLTFDVDEGMRYKVREITFLGIFAFKPEQIWAVQSGLKTFLTPAKHEMRSKACGGCTFRTATKTQRLSLRFRRTTWAIGYP